MPASPLTSKSNENKENESGQVESVGQYSEASSQPSNPIGLLLPWDTRDCIMNCFNEFSSLLLRAAFSNYLVTEKMRQTTNDLVNRLICLHPVASSDTQSDCQNDQRPRKKRRVGESGESKPVTSGRQPFLEMPFGLRSEVVDQLFCNLNAIVDFSVGSNKHRKQIADQNTHRNIQLLELPAKVTNSHASDESETFADEPQLGKA